MALLLGMLTLAVIATTASAGYTVTTTFPRSDAKIAGGYIVETYRNEDDVCDSIFMFPGQNMVWSRYSMGILTFLGLIWCFLGVAIVADLFMGAIEVITSKEVEFTRKNPETNEEESFTALVWNPTIANLSLMALGSSAPEILLALIGAAQDLGTSNVDELGPGTIVGSAAFNLLVISGICVMAIPDGEGKFFGAMEVFYVTAFASVFAYVWLYIVVASWTPDIVTIEEALLTFAFFPFLLGVAYCADKGYGMFKKPEQTETQFRGSFIGTDDNVGNDDNDGNEMVEAGVAGLGAQKVVALGSRRASLTLNADKHDLRAFVKEMQRTGAQDIETVALAEASMSDLEKPTSRNKYRINATKMLSGKASKIPSEEKRNRERKALHAAAHAVNPLAHEEGPPKVSFRTAKYAVLEDIGKFQVSLIRHGSPAEPISVRVKTRDGTATVEDQDYDPLDLKITFEAGVTEQLIEVKINDDDQPEEDEEFFIDLTDTEANKKKKGFTSVIGDVNTCTIEIIDDDKPGTLSFEFTEYVEAESKSEIRGNILRRNGASGVVSCCISTIEGTASGNVNFEPLNESPIKFENKETSKPFVVKLIDTASLEPLDVSFKIKLNRATGDAILSRAKLANCRVTNDSELQTTIERLKIIMENRSKVMSVETTSWLEQFKEACTIAGEVDEVTGEMENPPTSAYVLHFLSIFWKVIFAVVPPTSYHGGWAAFYVAVAMVGGLTFVVGELAGLFGCAVGLKAPITAITFVALGTSLPDTFASAAAARGEDTADAAVGNVTGSNAVNVFLGLGLPWMVSSFYWVAKGIRSCEMDGGTCPDSIGDTQGFYLPAGDLAFSVIVFVILAILAILILILRNFYCDGALGGVKWAKKPTAALFVTFWLVYIILASLKTEKYFEDY
jgi:solute carrier family 8 (sodium/calcium exchanger)